MKNFFSFFKNHKIFVIIAFSLIVILFIFFIPFIIGNGINKFSGVKRQVAEEVVRNEAVGKDFPLSYPLYVEDVYSISETKAREVCKLKNSEPADGYYAVDASRLVTFGFRDSRLTHYDCYTRYPR